MVLISPLCRHVHPPHVEVWSEEPQPPVHAAVSLHTLVQLLGVVEHLPVAIVNCIKVGNKNRRCEHNIVIITLLAGLRLMFWCGVILGDRDT